MGNMFVVLRNTINNYEETYIVHFCLFHIGIGYAQDVWPSHKVTDINGKIRDLKSYAPDSGVVLFVSGNMLS